MNKITEFEQKILEEMLKTAEDGPWRVSLFYEATRDLHPSTPFVFFALERIKHKYDVPYCAIAAIENTTLSDIEIIEIVKRYCQGNWRTIRAAIESNKLSPEQIVEVLRYGQQFLLDEFERRWRAEAVSAIPFNALSIKQVWQVLLLTRCFRM